MVLKDEYVENKYNSIQNAENQLFCKNMFHEFNKREKEPSIGL